VRFAVSVDSEAVEFINTLNDKSRQIIRSRLESLTKDPFPGKGGDKELLKLRRGTKIYRLHIGRTFTAFYTIDGNSVFITEVMTIEQAHKKYKSI
jgi:mRNA-degrading endonuclease RelE of RelBE toxin-antitoxin system